MELGEKLLHLRAVEGELRGLGRPMTQTEVAAALRQELGLSLSQAYLSQIEGGKRVHLSNKSREALASFFRVHPGYLVNDPPGYFPDGTQPAHHVHQPHTPQVSRAAHGIPGFALVPGLPGMPPSRSARQSPTPLASEHERAASRDGTETARANGWSEWTAWPVPQRQARASISSTQLERFLSRLRDHPDAERVLLVMEQALTLSPDQFDVLSRELARLSKRDEAHPSS